MFNILYLKGGGGVGVKIVVFFIYDFMFIYINMFYDIVLCDFLKILDVIVLMYDIYVNIYYFGF